MSDTTRTRGPMEHSRPATEFEVMQQEHIEQLERENAELRNLLRIADDLIDEYAEVVEHCDNVDEIREQIKAALAAERAGK